MAKNKEVSGKFPKRKYRKSGAAQMAVSLISLLLIVGSLLPAVAKASALTDMVAGALSVIRGNVAQADTTASDSGNVQTMQLPKAALNMNAASATGGGDITVADDSALVPEEGPSGTIADIVKPKNSKISTYVVHDGDTLGDIAKMFDVSVGTILSANDLPNGAKLHTGDKLVILPITGIDYTVKKGDTLASIAKATGGDASEIGSFNNIDDSSLAVGSTILIPDGEASAPVAGTPADSTSNTPAAKPKISIAKRILSSLRATGSFVPDANNPAEPSHDVGHVGNASEIAYYVSPLTHYIQTQGIHGYNAVDLADPIGTPILAAASGVVEVAKQGGWNGGYGSYVVIQHGNGSQTLYGHMSKVSAYDGETVVQGQVIGYVGESGEATGPHLHFEIRNGIRNPF